MCTHQSNGTGGVLEWRGMVVLRSNSILQHKSGDADRIQPLRDRLALVICKVLITSAGTHYDCRSIDFFFGKERRQRRDVIWSSAQGSRCAVWPKLDWLKHCHIGLRRF